MTPHQASTVTEMASSTNSEKPRIVLERKQYKGIWMFENEVEKIEVMDVRPDDIWVCSYPRSGTCEICKKNIKQADVIKFRPVTTSGSANTHG